MKTPERRTVGLEGKDVPKESTFDKVLIAVGRVPNSDNIGLENTAVEIDKFGFVGVDQECRTADKRILAIGDVSGQPMLAHRAMRQGKWRQRFWLDESRSSTTGLFPLLFLLSRKLPGAG